MESRNISLTACGDKTVVSPQDRKAVGIENILGHTEEETVELYPLRNLIPEIISDENMERSFRRVMTNLRASYTRKRKRKTVLIDGIDMSLRMVRYMKNKRQILNKLREQIADGIFRVKNLKSFETNDGPKVRTVTGSVNNGTHREQCDYGTSGKALSPVLNRNNGRLIEGRGPHGLFHQIQEAIAGNPKLKYYYQSDYKGYYDNILHDRMIAIIRRYVADPASAAYTGRTLSRCCIRMKRRYQQRTPLIAIFREPVS